MGWLLGVGARNLFGMLATLVVLAPQPKEEDEQLPNAEAHIDANVVHVRCKGVEH
jgi:hypothetical protein